MYLYKIKNLKGLKGKYWSTNLLEMKCLSFDVFLVAP